MNLRVPYREIVSDRGKMHPPRTLRTIPTATTPRHVGQIAPTAPRRAEPHAGASSGQIRCVRCLEGSPAHDQARSEPGVAPRPVRGSQRPLVVACGNGRRADNGASVPGATVPSAGGAGCGDVQTTLVARTARARASGLDHGRPGPRARACEGVAGCNRRGRRCRGARSRAPVAWWAPPVSARSVG